jgi:hypothetical protein
MPIKTFRGKIADGAIDTVSLHTNNGSTGYRIVKLEAMGVRPAATDQESILKIYTTPQTAVTDTVDLSDQTLVAVCFYDNSNATGVNAVQTIVVDNVTINQDIFITHSEGAGASACNYYIELEQIRLDLNENTVATLKDIRNITGPT